MSAVIDLNSPDVREATDQALELVFARHPMPPGGEEVVRAVVDAALDAAANAGLVDRIARVVVDALDRDPVKLRARAARARARGNEERATKLEELAAQIALRQAMPL